MNSQAINYYDKITDKMLFNVDLTSLSSSRDDLVALSKAIERENVRIDGQNVNEKRKKRITKNVELLDIGNPEELEKMRRLTSLERTLKVSSFLDDFAM